MSVSRLHVLFTCTILLLSALIDAFPISQGKRSKRDISQTLLSHLYLFEQYAAAAYCPDNNVAASDTTITCSAGNCPQVQTAGAQSVLEFENVGISDATGFVAVDPTNRLIVVSFRGSQSPSNWIANLNIIKVPWGVCAGCDAHAGFLESWTGVKPRVRDAIDKALVANPGFSIVATGHSLGGALATLMATDLRNEGYAVSLYTYGSPMVGNHELATFITNQSAENYRVTHAEDIVPKLPGYLIGYAHVSPEYWIKSSDDGVVGADDIRVSTGVVNLKGNQGTIKSSVLDHLWYFNDIAACGPIFDLKE